MSEEKKDNLDEIIAVNRELQNLTDDLDENKKQAEKLIEADDIAQQIYRENTDILDELAYYWKGDKANRFLHMAHEDNEHGYRESMRELDEINSTLQQKQKLLLQKEEDLLSKQRKLKQENS
ncbi:DUF3958 family protein [Enterococcus sp. BWM-S5]|uniref:DUF3958 family protein n=1 Tax=Enterococcus larvae TaxID=2794352 RepID=A0ABS4CHQ1_9ENTE|nr:DUF3958 family protein [Enterococcus larvae]MBP1046155.1 DUF3958 family protein [Enterococcus larvae]